MQGSFRIVLKISLNYHSLCSIPEAVIRRTGHSGGGLFTEVSVPQYSFVPRVKCNHILQLIEVWVYCKIMYFAKNDGVFLQLEAIQGLDIALKPALSLSTVLHISTL